jgi:hypothetical protein
MNTTDFEKFRDLLVNVHSFYGKNVSQFSLDLWWEAMRPFELADVQSAMNRHCVSPDTGQFLPKPADIVKALRGTTANNAAQAWAKVDRAIRRVGSYQSVVFDDPIIHAVLHDMGGWILLGEKTEDEWPFVAREFENRYRGYVLQNSVPEYPKRMIGRAEMHNTAEGHRVQSPVLIGDEKRALLVHQSGSSEVKKLRTLQDVALDHQGLKLIPGGKP